MWDQNYKNGFGIFTNSDGSQYIGMFKYDRMIDYNPNGIVTNSNLNKVASRKPTTIRSIPPDSEEKDKQTAGGNSGTDNIISRKLSSTNHQVSDKNNKFAGNLDIIPEEEAGANTNKPQEKPNQSQPSMGTQDLSTVNIQSQIGKNVVSNRVAKESEFNPYKVLLDITDLIECEPEIEASLREIENTMLRVNSEIKIWYKMYVNKEFAKDRDGDKSHNSKIEKGSSHLLTDENRRGTITSQPFNIPDTFNNDLGYALEIKELWRFLRDCNITSSEFTLATFNRLFYKGPKNYIEMFMVPEELDTKYLYEYIYKMIQKSKDEFCLKFRDKLSGTLPEPTNSGATINYKVDDIEITFDIHNKRQVILLRQFSEAIIRIAYLKYLNFDAPLHVKVRKLIDEHIKKNALFKRLNPTNKSQIYTESSVNTSVVLDIKVKNLDSGIENFTSTYEAELKAIFKELYQKSTFNPKKFDMTITFRFLYENIIKKCPQFSSFLEKYRFVELINTFHNDKKIITEETKNTKEIITYIENLLDIDMIFYEFCEVIFFISKKFFINNNYPDNKNNYFEIFRILDDQIKKLEYIYENKDRYNYYYPKQKQHIAFEIILENKRLKEEEEKKKAEEVKRYMMERKLLQLEDVNIVPEDENGEEDEYDEDEDDTYLN
jgi:hypothetical protein